MLVIHNYKFIRKVLPPSKHVKHQLTFLSNCSLTVAKAVDCLKLGLIKSQVRDSDNEHWVII